MLVTGPPDGVAEAETFLPGEVIGKGDSRDEGGRASPRAREHRGAGGGDDDLPGRCDELPAVKGAQPHAAASA